MARSSGIPIGRTDDDGSYLVVVNEMLASDTTWASTWRVTDRSSQSWIRLTNDQACIPDQGWKLHVSASILSAEDVLGRALPILFNDTASFKIAQSRGELAQLNGGYAGSSQVGKFITVYPNDDDQAIRLALALDDKTRGLRGPRVPSDRQLRPDSIVYYRYGGFRARRVRTSVGAIKAAVLTPGGIPVPDERLAAYRKPDWVADPFDAAGITRDSDTPSLIIAGRYLVMATLYRSVRGAVYLGMDIDNPRQCVLKRARCNAGMSFDGYDAINRLRREAEFLRRLEHDPRFPALYDVLEQDGDLYLAMEDIEGKTLEEHVAEVYHTGGQIPTTQVISWGKALASILATIHARGIFYRDLKSANLLLGVDGRLRLLDFDAAIDLVDGPAPFLSGTFGYMSPQHEEGANPTELDDVYGLGAVLYFIATGVEPSNAPNRHALLDRPIELLNPTIGPELVDIIVRCLDLNPMKRFSSAADVEAALAAVETKASNKSCRERETEIVGPDKEARAHALGQARRLGDTLRYVSKVTSDGRGRFWLTTHGEREGIRSPDLNTGNAGTILGLAEIVEAFGDPEHREVLAAGAYTLLDTPRPEGPPLAGLYVGESGAGAALLRAGQILDDAVLVAAAADHGTYVATMPWGSPDLFNGTAGRLRFHLWLWDETGNPDQLQAALAAGGNLLHAAEHTDTGGTCWRIPDGYDVLSGQTQPGYAHGAAGIADALLDLFDVTGDERFLHIAGRAGRWIAQHTSATLDDGSGANWPMTPGSIRPFVFWCHGAAGIGRFFLHLEAAGGFPRRKGSRNARHAWWLEAPGGPDQPSATGSRATSNSFWTCIRHEVTWGI